MASGLPLVRPAVLLLNDSSDQSSIVLGGGGFEQLDSLQVERVLHAIQLQPLSGSPLADESMPSACIR